MMLPPNKKITQSLQASKATTGSPLLSWMRPPPPFVIQALNLYLQALREPASSTELPSSEDLQN